MQHGSKKAKTEPGIHIIVLVGEVKLKEIIAAFSLMNKYRSRKYISCGRQNKIKSYIHINRIAFLC
jgi:hypothetical protein